MWSMKRNRKRSPGREKAKNLLTGPLAAVQAAGKNTVARLRRSKRTTAPVAPLPQTQVDDSRGLDLWLIAAVIGLLGLGMVLVFSSSAVYAAHKYHSHFFFLKRNLIYGVIGLVALFVGWKLDYSLYQRWTYPLLIGCLLMLIGLALGLGTRVDGAMRWYRFMGVSFQPSELAKFALAAYLAYSLAKKRGSVRSFSVGFLPTLGVAGLLCVLILRQPDLGTAAVMGVVTLLVLFVAGTKLSYIVISLMICAPIGYQLVVGTPWRLRRFLAFLDPWAYRQDAGYQISESLISIGSGGFFGLGVGDGKQKLFFLPASHTDFIFAIVGEELGLLGLSVVVLLFGIIIARGVRAALGARDLFGTYLALGITSTIGLQAILHMCVVLGLVPTKGITLPLMSYGGSALVTTLFSLGVLLNIAARNPTPVRVKLAQARSGEAGNKRRAVKIQVAEES